VARALTVLAVAAVAWVATALEAGRVDAMPGTMDLGPGAFIGIWTLMMAAMMLPAVAPLGAMYARSLGRGPSLGEAFAGGYLMVCRLLRRRRARVAVARRPVPRRPRH
jgi:predicted metal-binding membrane protein